MAWRYAGPGQGTCRRVSWCRRDHLVMIVCCGQFRKARGGRVQQCRRRPLVARYPGSVAGLVRRLFRPGGAAPDGVGVCGRSDVAGWPEELLVAGRACRSRQPGPVAAVAGHRPVGCRCAARHAAASGGRAGRRGRRGPGGGRDRLSEKRQHVGGGGPPVLGHSRQGRQLQVAVFLGYATSRLRLLVDRACTYPRRGPRTPTGGPRPTCRRRSALPPRPNSRWR